MHLYHVQLQGTSSIHQAITGHFLGTKQEQIVLGRNTWLELLSVDKNTGIMKSVIQQQVFGIIRSLRAIRLPGSQKGIYG
jgi:splicing factor 3B subunit 3